VVSEPAAEPPYTESPSSDAPSGGIREDKGCAAGAGAGAGASLFDMILAHVIGNWHKGGPARIICSNDPAYS
jgi:hypothetical protein